MECQMKLVVGQDHSKIEINTVPQVMSNASPVFRKMLQPDRFAEGQKLAENKPFDVPLPDDNPSAMKILCDILHLRTNMVPLKDMTSTLMASLATLVDKYDCAIAIQPWPKLWLLEVRSLNELDEVENMAIQELAKWTHISCHLGYEDLFRQCTSALIWRATKHDLTRTCAIYYAQLSGRVRAAIEAGQKNSILSFYNVCRDLINDLKVGKHCTYPLTYSSEYRALEAFNCSSMALGNAILAARQICDGKDWEKLENWCESPDYYYTRLLSFANQLDGPQQIKHLYKNAAGRDVGVGSAHNCCSLSLIVRVKFHVIAGLRVGLRLSEMGNQTYRKTLELGCESHSDCETHSDCEQSLPELSD